MPRTAKLFHNGRQPGGRLPSEFRFQGSEVFIRRDPPPAMLSFREGRNPGRISLNSLDRIKVLRFHGRPGDRPPQKRKLF